MSRRSLYLLIVCLLAAGCGGSADRSQPPVIRLGEDICDHCKMIISEARFAAALVRADGTALRFDDLGCLHKEVTQGAGADQTIWVRDYQTEAWVRGGQAHIVVSPSIQTPMASGMIAAGGPEHAAALAEEHGGEVLSLAAWRARGWE